MAETLDVRNTTIKLPAEALTDAHFSATVADQLSVRKKRHRFAVRYNLTDGTDVTALTELIHIAGGNGKITAAEVVPGDTAPNGGDKIWTLDILKSTSGGTFTTILVTTEDVNTSSVVRTLQSITLATKAYLDGDVFQVVVTVSGSSGNQGQGGCVILWLDEEPA